MHKQIMIFYNDIYKLMKYLKLIKIIILLSLYYYSIIGGRKLDRHAITIHISDAMSLCDIGIGRSK